MSRVRLVPGRLRPVLAAAAALLVALVALAAVVERDAALGDEIRAVIGASDVHVYRLSLVAGTVLDARVEADAGGGGGEADKGGGGDDGPAPALFVLDPSSGVIGSDTSSRPRVRVTAATTGTYRVEVRAGTYAGGYKVTFEGELPEGGGSTIDVSGTGGSVTLDAPVGASVRIDVRRKAGVAPTLVDVRDASGRSIGFAVRKATKNRVRTYPVPVTVAGGLVVEIAAQGGGTGTYEVRGRFGDDDDDLPEVEDEDEDREPRRIVVQLAEGADPALVASQLGYTLVRVRDGYAVLETPEGREGFEAEDARRAQDLLPEVLSAETDARLQTPEGLQSNGVVLGSSLGRSDFDRQAALAQIRAEVAHRRATGQGVVVAVLDTGVDATHSLLAGHVLPGHDFVAGDDDPSEEENGLDDDGDGEIDEGFGHGTFVAGLVLAAAPDAQILPVRVLDTDARGTISDIAAGIRWAVDHGATVVNLSLGARARSDTLRGEVRYALSRGVAVVAATGNAGDPAAVNFPAGLTGVVAVAALDATGARAPFSNAGVRTTLAAPGTGLVGPYPGERWGTWDGTSFATALASGGVALLEQQQPDLRATQVVRTVARAAKPLGRRAPAADRKALGAGALDLSRLVK